MAEESIVVLEDGKALHFSVEDMLRYHGGGSPGGVAHAFKVLERALVLLEPSALAERREIHLETAFGGPGARDAFELVTRAVTGQRYHLESSLSRPELGRARERFVFRIGYRRRTITLVVRPGFVTEEFVALAGRSERTRAQEDRLRVMKGEMAVRVMSAPAHEVYELAGMTPARTPGAGS